MDGLSIIGVAIAVGLIVYAVSLRRPDEPLETDALPPPPRVRSRLARRRRPSAGPTAEDLGFGDDPTPLERERAPESFIYVPVLQAKEPEWRTRVGAVVGLLLLVAAGASAVAIAIYQLGHVLNGMIEGFLGG